MRLMKKYKIEKAAASPKGGRVIAHVMCMKNRVVAADGSILACVPCVTSLGDVPGTVTQESLAYARQHSADKDILNLRLKDSKVCSCEDSTEFPRNYGSGVDEHGELFRKDAEDYPDVMALVPAREPGEIILRINPHLLAALASALGDVSSLTLFLVPDEDRRVRKPIRVHGASDSEFGAIVPQRS